MSSHRMTRVRPRQRGPVRVPGYAVHSRKTRAEMIAAFRDLYQRQLAEAQAALALTDDELIVETYIGPYAMQKRREVTGDA